MSRSALIELLFSREKERLATQHWMETNLTYEDARSNIEKILINGQVYKADVFITRSGNHRFVIKDYGQKGFWERNLVGRFVIGRETKAYAALAGLDGLPMMFKRISPFALAVEYLEGKDFGAVGEDVIGPDIIGQFERIVRDLHARGWVHLDLHRRTNILLVHGKVFVLDLASALHTGMIPYAGRCLTRLIGLADLLSLIKMKTIFAPQLLTDRERTWLKVRNKIMPTKWESPLR